MRDIMIDIETLGTRPGSVIASIGAVEFDALTGEFGRTLYTIVDIASAQTAGLTLDADTVKWWMKQGDEARAKTFSDGCHINTALLDLRTFVETCGPARIWAHSPSFDLVQLEAAYRSTFLHCPWTYRQPRDTRTLFDLAGVKIQTAGTHHDALDDARAQAETVIEAYRALGLAAPSPKLKERRDTITVPAGFEAVRDADGRATGEVRSIPTLAPISSVRAAALEEAVQAVEGRISAYEGDYEQSSAKALNLAAIAALTTAVINIRALAATTEGGK